MHYRLDPDRRSYVPASNATAIATRPVAMRPVSGTIHHSPITNHRAKAASPGEGSAPLSNNQKASIAILAKDAWVAVGPEEDLETWRHQETGKAVGVESLRVACQRDYLKILSHFQRLAGEDQRAAHSEIRAETGPGRTAWHVLQKELASRGLQEGYAAAICKSKYKRTLGEATPGQLWKLVYDVRTSKHPVLKKEAAGKEEDPF